MWLLYSSFLIFSEKLNNNLSGLVRNAETLLLNFKSEFIYTSGVIPPPPYTIRPLLVSNVGLLVFSESDNSLLSSVKSK